MKIALIYLGRRGGGATFSLELMRGLAPIAPVRAFLSESLENRERWEQSGLDAAFFPVFDNGCQAALSTLAGRRLRSIAQAVRAWAPDVLLITMFHPWNGLLQRALAGIPTVVIVHDPLPHPGFTAWLHRVVEDFSLKKAAQGIVLSQGLAPALARRGIPLDRIGIVPHGLLNYRPTDEEQAGPNAEGSILFFGRIAAYKGLEILLQAFALVRQRCPDLCLQIVGEGDLSPYRQELAELDGIELINRWVSEAEIPAFFTAARMVVVPYTSATQSGVIPIAAGFGLPVIATCAGGLAEQIDDQRTGLLVPPGDEQALAGAIERLALDPALAGRLGAALRVEFEEHRNWQTIGNQVLAYCRKAIQSGGRESRA